MIVKCKCCGNDVDVPITTEHYKMLEKREGNIQDILPDISPGLREMLISGICPTCWDILIDNDEEDD